MSCSYPYTYVFVSLLFLYSHPSLRIFYPPKSQTPTVPSQPCLGVTSFWSPTVPHPSPLLNFFISMHPAIIELSGLSFPFPIRTTCYPPKSHIPTVPSQPGSWTTSFGQPHLPTPLTHVTIPKLHKINVIKTYTERTQDEQLTPDQTIC